MKTWEPLALTAKVTTAQCAETTERRTTTSTPAHLRSARVVVVDPAAIPPASAPIGHARPTAAGARAPLIGDDRPTYVSEVFGRNMDCVTQRVTSCSRVSDCDLPRVEVNICSGCKGSPWGSILQSLGRIALRAAPHKNHMKFIRTKRKSYVPYENRTAPYDTKRLHMRPKDHK